MLSSSKQQQLGEVADLQGDSFITRRAMPEEDE